MAILATSDTATLQSILMQADTLLLILSIRLAISARNYDSFTNIVKISLHRQLLTDLRLSMRDWLAWACDTGTWKEWIGKTSEWTEKKFVLKGALSNQCLLAWISCEYCCISKNVDHGHYCKTSESSEACAKEQKEKGNLLLWEHDPHGGIRVNIYVT